MQALARDRRSGFAHGASEPIGCGFSDHRDDIELTGILTAGVALTGLAPNAQHNIGKEFGALRERMAHLEGLFEGLRKAIGARAHNRGAAWPCAAARSAKRARGDGAIAGARSREEAVMRKLLRKVLPESREIRGRESLRRVFGRLLLSPDLWHLNRGSVAWAVSIGLFIAWTPVPFQMLLAAGAAITVRCNLPISIAMVWISNPITAAPLFYTAYKLGALILDVPPTEVHFEVSLRWLLDELGEVWEPFLLGCFVMGLASALLGQVVLRIIWRVLVMVSWRERRIQRQQRNGQDASDVLPPAPAAKAPRERGLE